jgi:carboxymethylenebutenolidase
MASRRSALSGARVEVGDDAEGFLAIPEAGTGPGVIVIQEWWGMVPHIMGVVERFASEGFVALAIDHYRGVAATEPDEAQKLMLGLRIADVAADLAAAADYLAARTEVSEAGIRVTGFCMGGGLTLLAPTVSDRIVKAAAFYPAMPWPDYAPDWSRYAGKAAIVHKAASDESWAGPAIAEYASEIASHSGAIEVFEYADSQHAFFNDDRPEVFHAEHARLAWERTLDFFRS